MEDCKKNNTVKEFANLLVSKHMAKMYKNDDGM